MTRIQKPEGDAQIAECVASLLAAGKSSSRIVAETGLPKILVARVARLIEAPAALNEVLAGRQGITRAFKMLDAARVNNQSESMFHAEFIDKIKAGRKPVDRQPTPPEPKDNLTRLAEKRLITEAEAAAGRVLCKLARGWTYPGLAPAAALLHVWPTPLRTLWQALRTSDWETMKRRLPTASLAVWNIAVDDSIPGCLIRSDYPAESASEIEAIRIGLRALVTRIAEGLPLAEVRAAPERSVARRLQSEINEAIRVIADGGTVERAMAATGLSREYLRRIRQIYTLAPDLLPRVAAGEVKLYEAIRLGRERHAKGVAA